ncbi:MAG: SDR family NAD(P)-dependent oxidoreductase [Treponema sp.]|nr:SDR family NAD(P)-dependent oxidoreductase [Treponema sp.]
MKKTKKKKNDYLKFWEKYGPYAVVAGGSNGLGAAFAESLARRGMNLILLAREKECLEVTARRLREKYSVDITTFSVDLADYEKVKEFILELISGDKPKVSVGLLVYNAAFAPIGLFENTSEEHLSLAAAVNVRTPLLLSKLLSTQMIEKKRGGIVLMSSLASAQGSPKLASYAATKAFNTVLAEGLWKELKHHGVNVIGCCAGAISTPGYEQASAVGAKKSKAAPGTMTAAQAAEKTIKALGKGPIIIPGGINKLAKFVLTRLLTKKAAIGIMSNNTKGLS